MYVYAFVCFQSANSQRLQPRESYFNLRLSYMFTKVYDNDDHIANLMVETMQFETSMV